jgi:lysyl-tRNA synthetase, class II
MMARALVIARLSLASFLGVLVVLAATGWLYLIQVRDAVPGGVVNDGLPLDELSRHSSVPLSLYLAVWLGAALALGALVRFARSERLSSAILLAVGVGGLLFAAEGVSILTVRQIPAHAAFVSAAQLRAVYLPALLAGLAGALFGRSRTPGRVRAPLVLSWLVAAVGLIGVVDAILPRDTKGLVENLAPQALLPVTSALAAPLGLVLLVVARGLARRRHRAWQLAVGVLAAATGLHLFHGTGYGAAGAGLVLVALVARRHDFDVAGDPDARPRVLLRLAIFAAGIAAYGFVALWVNRAFADRPLTLGFALRETGLALSGVDVTGSHHVVGAFGDWFPISVLVLGVIAVGSTIVAWLGPWRHRVRQEAREVEQVRELIARHGTDTLAPFVMRADKAFFFAPDGAAVLAYRVVGGIAIVSGDPIGPAESIGPLLQRFIAHAHTRGWRIAILGASERCLALYDSYGLHALYHGDEAVLDVGTFSLEGRAIRKVRQSVTRLTREGYHADVVHPDALGPDERAELAQIAAEWRGAQPEKGFVMALDDLFRLEGDEALFVIGRDASGRAQGFLHFAVSRAGAALSLSTMPRRRTTPNGFNEWLVCEAVAWASLRGFERVSLNFAPFAALFTAGADLSRSQRAQRRALLGLKGHFQLDNLLHFNEKFFPGFERRFVVYERRSDLPRVGIAALSAEAYLPWSGRGRDEA